MHHLDVLLDPALGAIVDMVLWSPEPEVFEAASCEGSVRFRRDGTHFEVVAVRGESPFADQSPDGFTGLTAERANPFPDRTHNSYPFAFEQVAQLFDHPAAPDVCVVHSAAHNWEDQGGHIGEHGSLGVVQARAPFVIPGQGVTSDGLVPRGGRLRDIAPTMAAPLGGEPDAHRPPPAGQGGARRADVLAPGAGR